MHCTLCKQVFLKMILCIAWWRNDDDGSDHGDDCGNGCDNDFDNDYHVG